MRRSAAVALLALAALACGGRGRGPEDPGVLRPPRELGADFLLRQSIEVRLEGAEPFRLEVALQHRGDSLTLVGLTPLGTRAFVIEQHGLEVSFTSHMPPDRAPPLDPRAVLLDLQRALMPVLATAGPLDDGLHRGELGGDVVSELWQAGRLHERRFRRIDGSPPGEVVVTYEGGLVPGESPPRIELDNPRLGYRLVVTTLARSLL